METKSHHSSWKFSVNELWSRYCYLWTRLDRRLSQATLYRWRCPSWWPRSNHCRSIQQWTWASFGHGDYRTAEKIFQAYRRLCREPCKRACKCNCHNLFLRRTRKRRIFHCLWNFSWFKLCLLYEKIKHELIQNC